MNSRFVLALAISAGMAFLVAGIFYQVAIRGQSPDSGPAEVKEVVVATKDLEIGSTIQPSDLRVESWPADKVPQGSFSEIEKLVERVPLHRILANEPVSERRLAPPGSGVGLSPKIPKGMRALSVRVDDVIGVAGFVLPEARVDVLLTGTPRNKPGIGRMTRTILSDVRVISAGENLEPDASGKPQRVPVVTLLVTPEEAEMLTLASSKGRIQLVLRNQSDDEESQTDGALEHELFAVSAPPPRPAPRPAPPPQIVQAEPPPVQIEMIRGDQRTVQSFARP